MDDEAARTETLAQSGELIDALSADLLLLRHAPARGRERRALLDRAFRHAHTLKGSASALADAAPFLRLAHDLEDLLDAARSGRVELDADTLDACDSAADSLALALDALARGGRAAGPTTDEASERLRRLLREAEARAGSAPEGLPGGAPDLLSPLPEEIAAQLSAAERRRLAAAVGEGLSVVSVRAAFDLDELDEGFRRLGDAVEEAGEIAATLPGALDADDAAASVGLRLVCATGETLEGLSRRLSEFGAEVELLLDAEAAETLPGAAGGGGARAGDGPAEFVRVPLAELDDLVYAASELFDDTTAALELARARAGGAAGAGGGAGAADEVVARLRRDFLSLEERVLALRMQTLAPALERAARAARSAARAAGKPLEIETAGGSARVDRAVVERIAGPLAHLLRNAVDHGIESPEERRAAGKSERGRVRLEATAEGTRVRVRVEDDGRGVDPERVGRAARAQGLVAEGAAVTEEQALRFIFRPGFSTAARVTETSGRGVGLDAVESAVESAGGEVRVRTRPGRGTVFDLHLPLALAVVPVVLVEAGGNTYALDAGRIAETGRLDESAITVDGARRFALWRGRTLPLVSLPSLLGRAGDVPQHGVERLSVVVATLARAASGPREMAAPEGVGEGGVEDLSGAAGREPAGGGVREVLVVADGVIGRRDALVRSLGRHATRWRGVGGAIDLRDGTVALMLDLDRLIEATRGDVNDAATP